MDRKRIAIIAPSNLPVPAVNGGAIETLIQNFIVINEIKKKLDIFVFSEYNAEAFNQSKRFKFSKFIYSRKSLIYNLTNLTLRFIRKFIPNRISHLNIIQIVKGIRRYNVDLIIVEGNSYHLLELAKYFPVSRLIFHMHAKLFNEQSTENSSFLASASKIVVVSGYIKSEILRLTDIDDPKLVVLPNGIDLTKFHNYDSLNEKTIRKKYNIKNGVPIVTFVGRIVEDKGILHLIKALIRIKNTCSFHLIIVGSFGSSFGSGDLESEFSDTVRQFISDNQTWISHIGFIHNNKLLTVYSISDIVVVPSLCDDAAPLVPLEAMASGKALITTDAGGIPEYVAQDAAIILPRDKDIINNLSVSINDLIIDKSFRKHIGEAGRKNVQRFNSENYYNNFINILSED